MVVRNYPGGKPVVILGTDGTDLYGLTVDAAGHLQIDALSSALPAGAATEATLAAALTALQLIDDFALGTNKLFGYNDRWAARVSELNPPAGAVNLNGPMPPANEIFVLQGVSAQDINSAITEIRIMATDGTTYVILAQEMAPAAGRAARWSGELVLKAGDRVTVRFYGVVAGDDLYLDLWGYIMIVP